MKRRTFLQAAASLLSIVAAKPTLGQPTQNLEQPPVPGDDETLPFPDWIEKPGCVYIVQCRDTQRACRVASEISKLVGANFDRHHNSDFDKLLDKIRDSKSDSKLLSLLWHRLHRQCYNSGTIMVLTQPEPILNSCKFMACGYVQENPDGSLEVKKDRFNHLRGYVPS